MKQAKMQLVQDPSQSNVVNLNNVRTEADLVADSHSILVTWRNHFSQLLNVHGVNDVRQTEINTAEPLVMNQVPLRLSWLFRS